MRMKADPWVWCWERVCFGACERVDKRRPYKSLLVWCFRGDPAIKGIQSCWKLLRGQQAQHVETETVFYVFFTTRSRVFGGGGHRNESLLSSDCAPAPCDFDLYYAAPSLRINGAIQYSTNIYKDQQVGSIRCTSIPCKGYHLPTWLKVPSTPEPTQSLKQMWYNATTEAAPLPLPLPRVLTLGPSKPVSTASVSRPGTPEHSLPSTPRLSVRRQSCPILRRPRWGNRRLARHSSNSVSWMESS